MFLFFVREFNDIDHITPVIWRMANEQLPVAVYCYNPEYDLKNDYRLQFLKKNGIKVKFIFDENLAQSGIIHLFIRGLCKASFRLAHCLDFHSPYLSSLFYSIQNQVLSIGKRLHQNLRKKYYNDSWAKNIIEMTSCKTICFDHVKPKRLIVKLFLYAAEKRSIPTIALPHGVYIYTNQFVRLGSEEDSRYDKFNRYDSIVTQNNLRKNVLVASGVDRHKIHVLGSARYCQEWMVQNKKILPRHMNNRQGINEKLRVVFMTTRFSYRIDVERMMKTFDLLSEMRDVDVVVKPHTRTGKEAVTYENMPLKNVSRFSSVELCEWADVMLVIGSSILIETLYQDKPVLYLKYLHDNITQYEELGACWTIKNENELKQALEILIKDKSYKPYSSKQVKLFLSEIIYGGDRKENRDVLEEYKNFIVGMKSSE
jgi:hypothetical protein